MRLRRLTALLLLVALLTSCMTIQKPVDRSYLIEAYVPSAKIVKTEQLVLDTTAPSETPTGQTVTQAVPEGTAVRLLEDKILTDDEIAEMMDSLEWKVPEGTVSAEIIPIGSEPKVEETETEPQEEEPAPLPEEPQIEIIVDDEVLPLTEEEAETVESAIEEIHVVENAQKKDPSMTGIQWQDMSADLSKTISEQSDRIPTVEISVVPPPQELYEPDPEQLYGKVTQVEVIETQPVVIEEAFPEIAAGTIAPEQDVGNESASAEPEEADHQDTAALADDSPAEEAEPAAQPEAGTPVSLPEDDSPAAAEPTATGLRRTLSGIKNWCLDHKELLFLAFCAVMLVLIVVLALTSRKKRKETIAKNPEEKAKEKTPQFGYKRGSWNVVKKSWPED